MGLAEVKKHCLSNYFLIGRESRLSFSEKIRRNCYAAKATIIWRFPYFLLPVNFEYVLCSVNLSFFQ